LNTIVLFSGNGLGFQSHWEHCLKAGTVFQLQFIGARLLLHLNQN